MLTATDEARARELLMALHASADIDAQEMRVLEAFAAVRREALEQAAKVAEDAQDQYRGGASVMARGFGKAIAEDIRALLPATKEGGNGD